MNYIRNSVWQRTWYFKRLWFWLSYPV